jgi:hypothetical protein
MRFDVCTSFLSHTKVSFLAKSKRKENVSCEFRERKEETRKETESGIPLSLLHSMLPTHEQTNERQNEVFRGFNKNYASVNILDNVDK